MGTLVMSCGGDAQQPVKTSIDAFGANDLFDVPIAGLSDADRAGFLTGDAIPAPPATWAAENPSPADLQTPFGLLYEAVHGAVDPTTAGSIVSQMNLAAALLGVPIFTHD